MRSNLIIVCLGHRPRDQYTKVPISVSSFDTGKEKYFLSFKVYARFSINFNEQKLVSLRVAESDYVTRSMGFGTIVPPKMFIQTRTNAQHRLQPIGVLSTPVIFVN